MNVTRVTIACRPAALFLLLFIPVLGLLHSPAVRAWGPIGHRVATETAALLLNEKAASQPWAAFLARQRFDLGYYANVPDLIYRDKDGQAGKLEAPTHLGVLGVTSPDQMPLAWEEARKRGGVEGSVAWRSVQFLSLARGRLSAVRQPSGKYAAGIGATGDDRRLFDGLYFLGVASHYIGDSLMPYHATADWNGYVTGQGGIHFYFEADCVNLFEPGLSQAVLNLARRQTADWLKSWKALDSDPTRLLFALLHDSASAVSRVAQIDATHAVTKRSVPGKTEDALRKAPAQGCTAFRQLLVERLAKAATATAFLWASVLPSGKGPASLATQSYSDIQGDPTFVAPDYTPVEFRTLRHF